MQLTTIPAVAIAVCSQIAVTCRLSRPSNVVCNLTCVCFPIPHVTRTAYSPMFSCPNVFL